MGTGHCKLINDQTEKSLQDMKKKKESKITTTWQAKLWLLIRFHEKIIV